MFNRRLYRSVSTLLEILQNPAAATSTTSDACPQVSTLLEILLGIPNQHKCGVLLSPVSTLLEILLILYEINEAGLPTRVSTLLEILPSYYPAIYCVV